MQTKQSKISVYDCILMKIINNYRGHEEWRDPRLAFRPDFQQRKWTWARETPREPAGWSVCRSWQLDNRRCPLGFVCCPPSNTPKRESGVLRCKFYSFIAIGKIQDIWDICNCKGQFNAYVRKFNEFMRIHVHVWLWEVKAFNLKIINIWEINNLSPNANSISWINNRNILKSSSYLFSLSKFQNVKMLNEVIFVKLLDSDL